MVRCTICASFRVSSKSLRHFSRCWASCRPAETAAAEDAEASAAGSSGSSEAARFRLGPPWPGRKVLRKPARASSRPAATLWTHSGPCGPGEGDFFCFLDFLFAMLEGWRS